MPDAWLAEVKAALAAWDRVTMDESADAGAHGVDIVEAAFEGLRSSVLFQKVIDLIKFSV
ncbi:MAG: hypothetical protein U1D29_04870 [Burkholderiales bacterium]|nr:hypothetical protein [Burkholderiales bacterium]